MEPGHCPCQAWQSLQEMELKFLTPLGSLRLPEHLEVASNEGDLLLVLFHT